jgi:hypothetical protein
VSQRLQLVGTATTRRNLRSPEPEPEQQSEAETEEMSPLRLIANNDQNGTHSGNRKLTLKS